MWHRTESDKEAEKTFRSKGTVEKYNKVVKQEETNKVYTFCVGKV